MYREKLNNVFVRSCIGELGLAFVIFSKFIFDTIAQLLPNGFKKELPTQLRSKYVCRAPIGVRKHYKDCPDKRKLLPGVHYAQN